MEIPGRNVLQTSTTSPRFHYHPLLVPGEIDSEAPVSESEFIEHASGFAYGAGLYLERQYRQGKLILNYSYSQAKRRYPGRFDNRLETTSWNEPNRLSLNHSHALTPSLSTNIRAYGIWDAPGDFVKRTTIISLPIALQLTNLTLSI